METDVIKSVLNEIFSILHKISFYIKALIKNNKKKSWTKNFSPPDESGRGQQWRHRFLNFFFGKSF